MAALQSLLQQELEILNGSPSTTKALLVASGSPLVNLDIYERRFEEVNQKFRAFRDLTGLDVHDSIFKFLHDKRERLGSPQTKYHEGIDSLVTSNPLGICWVVTALFYDLAERNGAPLILRGSIDCEHARLRRDNSRTVIDAFESLDCEPLWDEVDVDFREFLSVSYLNRCDTTENPEEKAQYIRNAMLLAPHNPMPYSELGGLHIDYGTDPTRAILLCAKALKLRNHPYFRSNLAMAYAKAGRKDQAEFHMTMLQSEFPMWEKIETVKTNIQKIIRD